MQGVAHCQYMKMNVPLLNQVIDAIKADPKRLDMQYFVHEKNSEDPEPGCGTVGCIAGWAVLLKNHRRGEPMGYVCQRLSKALGQGNSSFPVEAQELLGLSAKQATKLFYLDEWPAPFREAYATGNNAKRRVQVTVDRIKHFVKTQGRD